MEEMKDIECPVCGSYNITISYNEDIAQAAFGTVVPFKEKVIKCNACVSTFSDDNISENPYSKALEQSKKESIGLILGSLLEMGYTLASMERALELPQRTMSQWKSGRDLSAAGIALLRIINTYPWIIEVADAKYDERYSIKILVDQAQNVWDKMMGFCGLKCSAKGGIYDQNNLLIFNYYNRNKEEENINIIPFPSESANSFDSKMISVGVTEQ